jgi:hypothetical protein
MLLKKIKHGTIIPPGFSLCEVNTDEFLLVLRLKLPFFKKIAFSYTYQVDKLFCLNLIISKKHFKLFWSEE